MQIRVIKNAKIYTGDQRSCPGLNALAIAGERIVALGAATAYWEGAPGAIIEDMVWCTHHTRNLRCTYSSHVVCT